MTSETTSKNITYTFNEKLGSGAHGDVFKATATENGTGSTVAIKILNSQSKALEFFNETAYLQLFSKNRVICEKYVACLRDVYFSQNKARLVYDFVDGHDLESIIESNNIFKEDPTVAIHLISGLNYFFRLGVYHLDIKPANIVMDRFTQLPKFIDWGSPCFNRKLTSLLEGPLYDPKTFIDKIDRNNEMFDIRETSSGTAGYNNCAYLGSPLYSPPELILLNKLRLTYMQNRLKNPKQAAQSMEQIKGILATKVSLFENNLGKLHDIWSLGVTLLEWYSRDYKYLNDIIFYEKDQEEINETIDHCISDNFIKTILKLMLTIDPTERLRNWNTVVEMVSEYCLSNDTTKGCPTESDTESINSFIRDAHSTSIDNWYSADIDPLEPRPTGQFNRITLDMVPPTKVINTRFGGPLRKMP